jgi:hypothetical protein
MAVWTLALLLAQAVPAEAPAEVRAVTVTFTDEKDAPVEGLTPDEMVVLENGVAREVVRADVDRRHLTLAVVVDTSEPVGSAFRLNIVDAVAAFITGLPEGTKLTAWGTGDRATRFAGPTTDRADALKGLKRQFPRGGNTLLDTIVEACKELEPVEGQRSAIVMVTGLDAELSYRDRRRTVDEARGCADSFMAVQFDVEQSGLDDRVRYEYVLETLTRETGGLYERPLSSMGVGPSLKKIGADLRAAYRVSYATLPEIKDRKLEITVARPGVKARIWPGKKT